MSPKRGKSKGYGTAVLNLENMNLSLTYQRRQDQENHSLLYDVRNLNGKGSVRELHNSLLLLCYNLPVFRQFPRNKKAEDSRKQRQFIRCGCYDHYHCKTSQPVAKVLTASGRERRRILYTNVTGCASPIHICKRRGTSCIQLSLLPRQIYYTFIA